MSEHRNTPRKRTLQAAIASFNQSYTSLRCHVSDISETGCRVMPEGSVDLPDTFELYIELEGMRVDCEVVWRVGSVAGVQFVGKKRFDSPKRTQVVQPIRPNEKPSLRRKDARIVPSPSEPAQR